MDEKIIEQNLIKQLTSLDWEILKLNSTTPEDKEQEMLKNIQLQLSKQYNHNFSEIEFKQIKDILYTGDLIFDKSRILRETIIVKLDDGRSLYVDLINKDTNNWCNNQYQILSQVYNKTHSNDIYDVILLINGIPIVHIELKKDSINLKDAFNQICRYNKNLYNNFKSNMLFKFVQLNVISNNQNTRYFANNEHWQMVYRNTFTWTDEKNNQIHKLHDFSNDLLAPCKLTSLINEMLPHSKRKVNIILKPFQYFAAKKTIDKIINSKENMYVYHATGTGKTLTAFRILTDLCKNKNVTYDYVILVLDRLDLAVQTVEEFNYFNSYNKDDGYKRTLNGNELVKELANQSSGTHSIITSIQQMNSVATNKMELTQLSHLKNKNVIYIIDECHRSTFGDQLINMQSIFNETRLIGFTGTPIFEVNKVSDRTTADIFGKCIHEFNMLASIQYEYILPLLMSYLKTKSQMDEIKKINKNTLNPPKKKDDIIINELEDIYDTLKWDENVVYRVIDMHGDKCIYNDVNKSYMFNAILAKPSIENACNTYQMMKQKVKEKNLNLKFAIVFSIDEELNSDNLPIYEEAVNDYNVMFNQTFDPKIQEHRNRYSKDVIQKMKDKEIDILIVVEMFLTGFDSDLCNTLYYDRSGKYHNLIQAFNRTTRICQNKEYVKHKDHGNIVCFKDIQTDVENALKLYNGENYEKCLQKPLSEFINDYNNEYNYFISKYPTPECINEIYEKPKKYDFCSNFSKFAPYQQKSIFYKLEGFEPTMSKDIYEQYLGQFRTVLSLLKETGGETTGSSTGDNKEKNYDFEEAVWLTYNVDVSMLLALSGKNQSEFIKTVNNSDFSDKKKAMLTEWIYSVEYQEFLNNDKINEKEYFQKYQNRRLSEDLLKFSIEENFNLDKLKETFDDICYNNIIEKTKEGLMIYNTALVKALSIDDNLSIMSLNSKKKHLKEKITELSNLYKENNFI